MVFKRIAAVVIWLLVTLTSAFGFLASGPKIAPGDFFSETLNCAGENEPGTRNLTWENGWLHYDTASGCLVATNRIDNLKFWNKTDFNGTRVYQRNDLFDPNQMTVWRENGKVVRGTNVERMATGRAPIGTDGKSVNLHHTIQSNDSPIAEVLQSFHQQNSSIIHINPNTIPSGIDRGAFNAWRSEYWINRAAGFQ